MQRLSKAIWPSNRILYATYANALLISTQLFGCGSYLVQTSSTLPPRPALVCTQTPRQSLSASSSSSILPTDPILSFSYKKATSPALPPSTALTAPPPSREPIQLAASLPISGVHECFLVNNEGRHAQHRAGHLGGSRYSFRCHVLGLFEQ